MIGRKLGNRYIIGTDLNIYCLIQNNGSGIINYNINAFVTKIESTVMVIKFIYSEKATKFCEIFPLL